MPIPQPPSQTSGVNSSGQSIPFAVDPPVVQDAAYRFTDVDRAYIDSQIRACEQHIVSSLVSGITATWATLDPTSAAGVVGNVVCLSGLGSTVTLATPSALANAGSAFGILLTSGGPGARVQIARGGLVPPSVTGLSPSVAIYAIVSAAATVSATSRIGPNDYPLGALDGAANVALLPMPAANNGGGATMWRAPSVLLSMPSDGNFTALSGGTLELQMHIKVGSAVNLTAQRNVVLPLINDAIAIVFNETTGAQSLQFIGATGSGAVVPNGKRALIGCDATNWFLITAPN